MLRIAKKLLTQWGINLSPVLCFSLVATALTKSMRSCAIIFKISSSAQYT